MPVVHWSASRRSVFTQIATCIAVAILVWLGVSPAGAAVQRSGWGLPIADDDWTSGAPDFMPSLGDGFQRLRPNAFRFQMTWDANQRPGQWTRAEKLIARAKAQGVQSIVVTFRHGPEDPAPIPSRATYKAAIAATVQHFEQDVDVWGPVNEPNNGWLKLDDGGPAIAADYFHALREVKAQLDPTALITSPDFYSSQRLGEYLDAYNTAGGGWGNVAAWHPYSDVSMRTPTATSTFALRVPANLNIWVTEVGAKTQASDPQSPYSQEEKMDFILNNLATHPRINRIFYYHMRSGNPAWDSALMNADSTPRPAWYRWCAAVHNDANHPDCTAYAPGNGSPEVIRVDGQLHVFMKAAATGMLWHRYTTPAGWSSWQSLGDGWEISSDPTAISWGPGRIDIFARGLDNALVHRYYSNGQWSPWESLGAGWKFQGKPSVVSWGPGHLDVFARGLDGRLIHRYYSNGWANWGIEGDWQMASDPVAYSWGQGRIDVFARGLDNALIHKWADNCCGWAAWEGLGAGWTFQGQPSVVSWGPGHLDVFARGMDGRLIHRYYSNGWGGWGIEGDWQMASDPVAYSWGSGRIDVFARGLDNALIHKAASNCCGWGQWSNLGSGWSFKGRPAPGSFGPGHMDVFASGLDTALIHRWASSGVLSPWESFGIPPVS